MKYNTLLYPLALVSIASAADPRLALVANININAGPGIQQTGTPTGDYLYVPVVSGTFNTTDPDPLVARFVAGTSDYDRINPDKSNSLNLAGGFQDTKSGDFFRYTASGYIQPLGPSGSGNLATAYGQIDAYQIVKINTNSTKYAWLNTAALVGQEKINLVNGQFVSVQVKLFRFLAKDNQTPFDPL